MRGISSRATVLDPGRYAAYILVIIGLVASGCGRTGSPLAPSTDDAPLPATSSSSSRYTLSGVVSNRDTTDVVAGARVEIVDGVEAGTSTTTGADGRYNITNLPAGDVVLRATADGFDAATTSITIAGNKTANVELRPSADAGGTGSEPPTAPVGSWTLSGRVTDARTGEPAPGAAVVVSQGSGASRATESNGDGRYHVADLAAGRITIEIGLDGYRPKTSTVELKSDRTLDVALEPETPAVPPGPPLSGQVVDALSNGSLSGVVVRVDGGGESTTGGDGRFTVAGTSARQQRVTLTSPHTVARQTGIEGHDDIGTLTLIPDSLNLPAFDEMFRARGGLHRWIDAPRLVIERRVLAFTNTTDMSYVATADTMTEAEAMELADELRWALPQLTGNVFTDFAGVDIEVADEGATVGISRPGSIVVARYDGLTSALSSWGYSRWAWNGAGAVQVATMMLDRDFEREGSPYRRSLRAHELGHTLGYDHVSSELSVMNTSARTEPTAFDRDGAHIAFLRRPLNQTPDIDVDLSQVRGAGVGGLSWTGAR